MNKFLSVSNCLIFSIAYAFALHSGFCVTFFILSFYALVSDSLLRHKIAPHKMHTSLLFRLQNPSPYPAIPPLMYLLLSLQSSGGLRGMC